MVHKTRRNKTIMFAAFSFADLLYHSVVREVRTSSGNASLGLLLAIAQSMIMLAIFALMYTVLGLKSFAIRGDFVIFLLTGIFLFLTHNKAIQSVMKAASPTSAMMMHAPMNTFISFLSVALSGLYLQLLSIVIILFAVHVLRGGLEFYNPAGLFFPFFMAWASGIGIGMLFLVLKPFAPKFVPMLSMMYRRANMITSGKMMPANYMTAGMVSWFDWNPLFHVIDQARGAAFVNYVPLRSNMEYPVYFTLTALLIGLMVEFWLRKNMSESWGKRSLL
ncbi:MAG: ABC transporter permease [Paracoccaceae bacterium]